MSPTAPPDVSSDLDAFHPAVARWFARALGVPTPAQRRGWAAIRAGRHTLIAAPTGSGKTLAAFLIAIDELLREAQSGPLPDEIRVVYVSPLKALSTDINRNLAAPLDGIRDAARELGIEAPAITTAVRTGDTTASARAALLRTPPHILVTTPESLYLMLTAERSRRCLETARVVIVDEIHAVMGTRRGAHLALTLERLTGITRRAPLRIGLSATQRPIDEVARTLVGTRLVDARGRADCAIVDEGHRRTLDLGLEIPRSPLEAVMSHEAWDEVCDRLAELIAGHRSALVFVNTRRLAERLARHLCERLGEDAVAPHHGSLSKERRLDTEERLKRGAIRAVVATASLELGIDIGYVDLVCQLGSPRRIATLLQRVGRAGHTVDGTPKGRLFPLTRDDLVECAALLRAVRRGDLDAIVPYDAPLDVLAQQIVAECACRDWREDELYDAVRGAWPYRGLARRDFDAVVEMLAAGFTTRRGRRGALIHRDEVQRRLLGRRGARLTALTSGGAIPDTADYRVLLEPEDLFIGTLNEDFAIESAAGDVFQLGNASWRILHVSSGVVRVADAHGAPPTVPFWFGEAPARSDELSAEVSDLRAAFEARAADPAAVRELLIGEAGLPDGAAEQMAAYFGEAHRMLGALPTRDTLVLERFFDDSGGMQLVLHAPFGARVNRAWALALRKRFCRQFNFELQAAATDDGLLLSLGPQHSFPLADVFRYLHPNTVRDILVQAFLDAPVFQTRWRWNASIALAVPRVAGGRKVPAQIQRMQAEDLLAAAFPDAAACLENIPGDREVPDHPLVGQTVRDCLEEAMDLPQLLGVLDRIHRGEIRCVARDTSEPSALCHELLNARPYAFLDDAPLEERRTQAVRTRRATDPARGGGLGIVDPAAVARVNEDAWPDPRDADELHEALVTAGALTRAETARRTDWDRWFAELAVAGRAALLSAPELPEPVWTAAERLPELLALHPGACCAPRVEAPPARAARAWTREAALAELLRGRMTLAGPVTAAAAGAALGTPPDEAEAALLLLEGDGVVLRGQFTPDAPDGQWCDRRLLARMHRLTLNRLRAEVEPLTPADFMRFLIAWQHVDPASRLRGVDGLRVALSQLDGFELAASAWERHVLPARVADYEPSMLDLLCFSGEVAWARLSEAARPGAPRLAPVKRPVRSTPIALFPREHWDVWTARDDHMARADAQPGPDAAQVLALLASRGALFAHEIGAALDLPSSAVRAALAELVAAGRVTSDGFDGLRTMIRPSAGGAPRGMPRLRARYAGRSVGPGRFGGDGAGVAGGRWAPVERLAADALTREAAIEQQAAALLRRYGIVFRRLLAREPHVAPWRELVAVYRRLEARGEIRGGRFVHGMSGEQFALPDAVAAAREIRRTPPSGGLVVVSGADPLNLAGIVTADERVAAVAGSRVVWRDGVPVAVVERGERRALRGFDDDVSALLDRRPGSAGAVAIPAARR